MGNVLGNATQCVRCITCKESKEVKVSQYIHADVGSIANGKQSACPHCEGTVYISCYGDDVPKLQYFFFVFCFVVFFLNN